MLTEYKKQVYEVLRFFLVKLIYIFTGTIRETENKLFEMGSLPFSDNFE